MRHLRALALVGFLAVTGCAHTDLRSLSDTQTGKPLPEQFAGTKATVTQFRVLVTPPVLIRVDSVALAGFDRLVFTFTGKKVPAYQLLYAPEGGANFEMRFGARANLASGEAAIPPSQQQRYLNYPAVKSVSAVKTGEEHVIWTASLAKATDYRVTELTNPPRLVVDLKH